MEALFGSEEAYTEYIQQEDTVPKEDLMSLFHVLLNRLEVLQTHVINLSHKEEYKKPRKVRTEMNRCLHRNRKNDACRSYICKKSTTLCHAHFSLYHPTDQSYLYGHR